jgi:hypothetical protein
MWDSCDICLVVATVRFVKTGTVIKKVVWLRQPKVHTTLLNNFSLCTNITGIFV